MRYRTLGRTGLRVSELCLGAMTFGGKGGMFENLGALDGQGSAELVGAALDAGVNFFDTANFYAAGESEQLLGRALGARRRDVVVATKVRLRMGAGPNEVGLSRVHVMAECEASLRRLNTDYIDLYQIHARDPLTPIDETLRALDDLVRQGKVRHIGASNLQAWELLKALWVSDVRRLERFESLQAYYNVAARELEREIVPALVDQQVGLMVWSPLAGGFLSGKIQRDAPPPSDSRLAVDSFLPVDRERTFAIVDVLRALGKERGASVAQMALAWLLAQPVVTSVIVGARKLSQLKDNLGSAELRLSAEDLRPIEAVSKLADEYPTWMLKRMQDR